MAGPISSIKVDGNELNTIATGGNYIAECPELDFEFEFDPLLVPTDGDYPVLVSLQPREGYYTLLITMKPCTDAVYQTQKAQLKGWLSTGAHAFAFRVRGMAAAKTFNAAVMGCIVDYRGRRLTFRLLAPKPVLV